MLFVLRSHLVTLYLPHTKVFVTHCLNSQNDLGLWRENNYNMRLDSVLVKEYCSSAVLQQEYCIKITFYCIALFILH